ncbi:unnamed protein product [Nippostrongylus brasiliensis]|uniref:MFS domain-containing protein n=1 Tax=Nippostrongylus brasiliensis TaxID=27835 RepID=A0A0N4YK48_NIPBR|nr:unnamed protein product [Nippostrongylus brasiliensis]
MGRYVVMVCIVAELMILPEVSSMFYMMYAEKEVCTLYQEIGRENCTTPALKYQFRSVNVEWNYFCESAKAIKNSISVQMIGVLIGSVVFGQLSDSFGRRKGLLATIIGMAVGWVVVARSSDIVQFTITRTVVGFFTGGSISLVFIAFLDFLDELSRPDGFRVLNVFIMENIPKKHRMLINMVITWSPNMLPFAGLAWLTGDWRSLALANAVVCIPGLLFCLVFIHESPRWLIQRGRLDEAREIMEKEHGTNKQGLVYESFDGVVKAEYELSLRAATQKRRYSYYHLFYTPRLATTTIVLAFSFFSTSIVNYGILFNMEKLSGSIYLNSVYTGLMRYACNLAFGYADLKYQRIGRKFVHTSGLVTILISLSVVIVAYALDLNHALKDEIRVFILLASSMTSQVGHFLVNAFVPQTRVVLGETFTLDFFRVNVSLFLQFGCQRTSGS